MNKITVFVEFETGADAKEVVEALEVYFRRHALPFPAPKITGVIDNTPLPVE